MPDARYAAAANLLIKRDLGTITVRDYLRQLLRELWTEEEGFSGKRPFGNGGWQFAVYQALIAAELLPGQLDEHGYVETMDTREGKQFMLGVIDYCLKGVE